MATQSPFASVTETVSKPFSTPAVRLASSGSAFTPTRDPGGSTRSSTINITSELNNINRSRVLGIGTCRALGVGSGRLLLGNLVEVVRSRGRGRFGGARVDGAVITHYA